MIQQKVRDMFLEKGKEAYEKQAYELAIENFRIASLLHHPNAQAQLINVCLKAGVSVPKHPLTEEEKGDMAKMTSLATLEYSKEHLLMGVQLLFEDKHFSEQAEFHIRLFQTSIPKETEDFIIWQELNAIATFFIAIARHNHASQMEIFYPNDELRQDFGSLFLHLGDRYMQMYRFWLSNRDYEKASWAFSEANWHFEQAKALSVDQIKPLSSKTFLDFLGQVPPKTLLLAKLERALSS